MRYEILSEVICALGACFSCRFSVTVKPSNGGKKLTGAQIFFFLTVICNISQRIMSDPSTQGRSASEKEDVVISCIHTATQFKHSLLIPDWLQQHGGWAALCDVADKIAQVGFTTHVGFSLAPSYNFKYIFL